MTTWRTVGTRYIFVVYIIPHSISSARGDEDLSAVRALSRVSFSLSSSLFRRREKKTDVSKFVDEIRRDDDDDDDDDARHPAYPPGPGGGGKGVSLLRLRKEGRGRENICKPGSEGKGREGTR